MEGKLEQILTILSTPVALRKPEMIQVLMDLTKNISFFTSIINDLGEKSHYQTCEYLSCEYIPANSIIFNEGDRGWKFYIILKGKVKILVNHTKSGVTEPIEIGSLEPGTGFGELALLKDQPRRATIICLENAYFMILTKEHYMRILGKYFAKKLDDKIEFLHSLKIFQNWSKKSLERLSFYFKSKNYRMNDVIYHKGDECDGVYAIVNGEIELTVSDFNWQSKDFPKDLKIALIRNGDIFGDDEILLNINRKYTVRCVSKACEVLWISKDDFITKINKESLRTLTINNYARNKIRQIRLKTIAKISKGYEVPAKSEPPKEFVLMSKSKSPKISPKKKFRSPFRYNNFSVRVIDSIKKKSYLNVSSPTAKILENCLINVKPRTANNFFNMKGFQPCNKNPSGVFQKIHEKYKLLSLNNSFY